MEQFTCNVFPELKWPIKNLFKRGAWPEGYFWKKKLYSFNPSSYIACMENFNGYEQSFQEALVEELLQLNPRQLTVAMV